MRAVVYNSFGGPEVLEIAEVPEPHAAANQIRIVVNAVGVNPIDWKIRSGQMGGDGFPRRTGQEVAGVVDEVGDDVTDVTAGDEVFGVPVGGGGAADFVVLEHYARIPADLDFVHAAALPVAVETAARTLNVVGVGEAQTVLVNGAAGAVGTATVQLAIERGARVIGTASEGNWEYLRSLGAEPTNYGDGLVERVRALAPNGVDSAIDAAGGGVLPALVELTGSPQRVVTIADYPGAEQTGVPFSSGMPGEERAWYALEEVTTLIEAGRFQMPVARTFDLEQIAEAHRLSEGRHAPGKIVLVVD